MRLQLVKKLHIMTNLYDKVPVTGLIRAIQKFSAIKANREEWSKVTSANKIKGEQDIREMRSALIPMLNSMDRNDSSFFPIGALVRYQAIGNEDNWDDFDAPPAEPVRFGVVIGHDNGLVDVRFEEKSILMSIKVYPQNLLLRYIRSYEN